MNSFQAIASELLQTVDAAYPELHAMSDRVATEPRAAGKWSPKQVIGHLIDSAANNHQRFVRALQGAELAFPGYAQDHWVNSQCYNDRPWAELIELWHGYNRHIAHVVAQIPEDRRQVPCTIGSNAPVTLEFLAQDYIVHAVHHLKQISDAIRQTK